MSNRRETIFGVRRQTLAGVLTLIAAFALIAIGIPLVGWVTYQNGPIWGLVILGAGASVLRWPLIYLVRRLRTRREPAE